MSNYKSFHKRDELFSTTSLPKPYKKKEEVVKYQPYLDKFADKRYRQYEELIKNLKTKNSELARSHNHSKLHRQKLETENTSLKVQSVELSLSLNQSNLKIQELESKLSLQNIVIQDLLLKQSNMTKMIKQQGLDLLNVSKNTKKVNLEFCKKLNLPIIDLLSPLVSLELSNNNSLNMENGIDKEDGMDKSIELPPLKSLSLTDKEQLSFLSFNQNNEKQIVKSSNQMNSTKRESSSAVERKKITMESINNLQDVERNNLQTVKRKDLQSEDINKSQMQVIEQLKVNKKGSGLSVVPVNKKKIQEMRVNKRKEKEEKEKEEKEEKKKEEKEEKKKEEKEEKKKEEKKKKEEEEKEEEEKVEVEKYPRNLRKQKRINYTVLKGKMFFKAGSRRARKLMKT